MTCTPNLTEIPVNAIFEENLFLGYGELTDDCGEVWNKIGIHTFNRQVNVLDFGADRTGVADSTQAFEDAIAALPIGGDIIIPEGIYAVNLVVTGHNRNFRGQQSDYNNISSYLKAYDNTLPVISVGDGTTATNAIKFYNLSIYANSVGEKGVKIYGAHRVWFYDCSVVQFEDYQVYLDSSATRETYFIHFVGCSFTQKAASGSLIFDLNYGAQYLSGVYLTDCDLNGRASGSYVIDLEANCAIYLNNTWVQAGNNRGIRLQAATASVIGSNSALDSDTGTDVLLTFDGFDALVTACVKGSITIDGKCSMLSGTTETLQGRHFVPYQSLMLYPTVQGTIQFQDSAAASYLQHAVNVSNYKVYRSGTTMIMQSVDGNLQFRPVSGGLNDFFTGAVQIRENAIAGTGSAVVLGKNTQTTIGAAGAASALPANPLGYWRIFIGSTEVAIPYYTRA